MSLSLGDGDGKGDGTGDGGPAECTEEVFVDQMKTLCADAVKSGKRVIVGIAGIPGSGKSTLAGSVCEKVNAWFKETKAKEDMTGNEGSSREVSVVVPMDGFHYSRAQLDRMENPEEAHRRRGSEWTFDAEGFGALLEQLRSSGESKEDTGTVVQAPTFDHALKDPSPGGVTVRPEHLLVFCEGNYLLLEKEPWVGSVRRFIDVPVFVDTPVEEAERRVVLRHVTSGICDSPESAKERWDMNDLPNALQIMELRDKRKIQFVIKGG
uniref:Phosphoribulokinase/uridine kinase domain-containing protein n=1 Tax=Chromera velia CCMP2878 TaxID=1169474 RepID=A0A0G4FBH0_9ALVE|eukprot:Cvel_16153.t1-p1 / transcript=Cvel_16153.t1 / gene=Cvel_16153 / organism=Chromera_velia_CCMP2878 / gene_product=Putative uridine kinase C227.14, putative / transcript_product=Putative uridine kinase C227.14, putative / location=Cvel_scaffold1230:37111-41284(-) / protein_length=265 / sequence_SO=supercontig / SO=protein_coding / is_pseudo=false